MIWLSDNNNLTCNKIVSVNDKKMKAFVEYEEGQYDLVSEHYISSLYQYPFCERTNTGFIRYKMIGLATVYDEYDRRRNGARIFASTYQYKKWLTLNIALEALGRRNNIDLNLNRFFENSPLDLNNMKSVNMNTVRELYFDYSGFLKIYPWITFEPICSYNLEQLRDLRTQLKNNGFNVSEIEEILKNTSNATTNSSVLGLTRRLRRKNFSVK